MMGQVPIKLWSWQRFLEYHADGKEGLPVLSRMKLKNVAP
jgi:hypothetical protein